jgi:hypothetical protein
MASTIFKWLKLWNYKLSHRRSLQWHHFLTKLYLNLSAGTKVIEGDTQTQTDRQAERLVI